MNKKDEDLALSMSTVDHVSLQACQSLPIFKEQCQELFYFWFLHDTMAQKYTSFLRFTLIMVKQAVNLSPVSTTIWSTVTVLVNSDSVVQQ